MVKDPVTEQDIGHLEAVETQMFAPLGWLYQRVYEDLHARGLVTTADFGSYVISDHGLVVLRAYREREGGMKR